MNAMQLSKATKGKSYQICEKKCSDALNQKLTLMGLGLGMVVELIALYKHGAVIQTPHGNIAVGSDLIDAISVAMI